MLVQTIPNTVPWWALVLRHFSLPILSLSNFFTSFWRSLYALFYISSLTLYISLHRPSSLFPLLPCTQYRGVLSAHLHDFLATDEKLSMHQATSLIAVFGAGAAFGGLLGKQFWFHFVLSIQCITRRHAHARTFIHFNLSPSSFIFLGGYLGGKLYAINRSYLPLFMGLTMAGSAVLMKELMNMDLDAQGISQLACPVLILAGENLGEVMGRWQDWSIWSDLLESLTL